MTYPQTDAQSRNQPGSAGGWRLRAADALQGQHVTSTDGRQVGTIKHILLDEHAGRIAYAVLSSGGFLGIGNHLHAVPWAALRRTPDGAGYVLNASAQHVLDAPLPDQAEDTGWAALDDHSWASSVHAHYSLPYVVDNGTPGSTVAGVPPGSAY
jgi:sporulation protein YlmC with PRC-barrel domain